MRPAGDCHRAAMPDRCTHGISFREPCAACEQVWREQMIRDLHREAARLGFRVVPIQQEGENDG